MSIYLRGTATGFPLKQTASIAAYWRSAATEYLWHQASSQPSCLSCVLWWQWQQCYNLYRILVSCENGIVWCGSGGEGTEMSSCRHEMRETSASGVTGSIRAIGDGNPGDGWSNIIIGPQRHVFPTSVIISHIGPSGEDTPSREDWSAPQVRNEERPGKQALYTQLANGREFWRGQLPPKMQQKVFLRTQIDPWLSNEIK